MNRKTGSRTVKGRRRPRNVLGAGFSITAVMKNLLRSRDIVTYEDAERAVKSAFPRSRFDRRHFSWYKAANKRGALKCSRGGA